jgi:hypothetical protein
MKRNISLIGELAIPAQRNFYGKKTASVFPVSILDTRIVLKDNNTILMIQEIRKILPGFQSGAPW